MRRPVSDIIGPDFCRGVLGIFQVHFLFSGPVLRWTQEQDAQDVPIENLEVTSSNHGKGRSSGANVGVDEATPRIGCEQNCSKGKGSNGWATRGSRLLTVGPPLLAVVTPR